ncbi:hypothetical protein CCACVL1_08958 [Corchorus capsularis]|uniref:BHLH domain-containing protein n=1 Tax=Corchorus capsularis TaxID=210143 RepID=A0A1R3IY95_COCAP|nr:hypothetical protein CCACVL1_08958 [Corchorus capsularis]
MESENVHHHHHQHQLQDQLVVASSSSSSSLPSYGVSSTHSWSTPSTPSFTLNNSDFNPSYNNGAMLNSEGSFTTSHDLHLSKIKDELSESLTKFTEMLTQNSNDVVQGSPPPHHHHHQLQQQKDLHDLSEKLLLKTISSGFPMFSAGEFYSSAAQNCSIPGTTGNLPSRGSFSQIYPSINISNLNQAAANNPSNSFDMNLEALDLLSSARFSRSSSFNSHPSNSHDHFDHLGIYKDSPYNNFGLHHYHQHMQQSNQRPTYNSSPSKISTTSFPSSTEITEAKRASISPAEPKATAAAGAAKKSRLDSRASCPPFKVRKEKLGDRIAALQQLVAPFGKTDTASVLMEAIGYIKFLQNQVETLSVPYMKSSRNKTCRPKQGGSIMEDGKEEAKRDLRSRGLCLVPLSCMSYVTNDSGGGIWPPPNFTGGT